MKKIMMVMLGSLLLILTACSQSNVYEYIIDESYTEFITMGTSAEYPPYEWPINGDGKQQIVGIDIEIAKIIAKAVGKNLKVINKGFDFLLEDLEQGKVDMVIAGMTPTEQRAEIVDFSKVYYNAVQVILIHENDQDVFTSFDSLNQANVRIGAQTGSIQQDLAETFTLAQKQFVQTIPDLVLRVQEGQIEALILEKPVADGYVSNLEGLMIADIHIGDPDGGSAVAVKKGNEALLTIVNQVIDELILSGQMSKIVEEMILLNSGS